MAVEETIVFDKHSRGFTSFQTFVPDAGVSLNNRFFTFKHGVPWEHNDPSVPRNSFYGGGDPESSVEVIFNDQPTSSKRFKTLTYNGDIGWEVDLSTDIESTVITDDGVEDIPRRYTVAGQVEEEDWRNKEGSFYAWIRNNVADDENVDLKDGTIPLGVGSILIPDEDEFVFLGDIAEDFSPTVFVDPIDGNLIYDGINNRWLFEGSSSFTGQTSRFNTAGFALVDTADESNFLDIPAVGDGAGWEVTAGQQDEINYDDPITLPDWLIDLAYDQDEGGVYYFRTINWTGTGTEGVSFGQALSDDIAIELGANLLYSEAENALEISGNISEQSSVVIYDTTDTSNYFMIPDGTWSYDPETMVTKIEFEDPVTLPEWLTDESFSESGFLWRTSQFSEVVVNGEEVIEDGDLVGVIDLAGGDFDEIANISLTSRTDDAEARLTLAKDETNPVEDPDPYWALYHDTTGDYVYLQDMNFIEETDTTVVYDTTGLEQYNTLISMLEEEQVGGIYYQSRDAVEKEQAQQTFTFVGSSANALFILRDENNERIGQANRTTVVSVIDGAAVYTHNNPNISQSTYDKSDTLGRIEFNANITSLGSLSQVVYNWYYAEASNDYTIQEIIDNGTLVVGGTATAIGEVETVTVDDVPHGTYDVVAVARNGSINVISSSQEVDVDNNVAVTLAFVDSTGTNLTLDDTSNELLSFVPGSAIPAESRDVTVAAGHEVTSDGLSCIEGNDTDDNFTCGVSGTRITVTGTQPLTAKTVTFTVRGNAEETDTITLGDITEFTNAGGTKTLSITQTGPETPTVTSKPDWITVGTMDENSTSVEITATANTQEARTGTITIEKDDSTSDSVEVSQAVGNTITVTYNLTNSITGNSEGYTIGDTPDDETGFEGDSYTFVDPTVTANGTYTFSSGPTFSGDPRSGTFGSADSVVERTVSGTVVLPTFSCSTWTGSVNDIGQAGGTPTVNVGNAASATVTSAAIGANSSCSSASHTVSVDVVVPSNYQNTGNTISCSDTISQPALSMFSVPNPTATVSQGGTVTLTSGYQNTSPAISANTGCSATNVTVSWRRTVPDGFCNSGDVSTGSLTVSQPGLPMYNASTPSASISVGGTVTLTSGYSNQTGNFSSNTSCSSISRSITWRHTPSNPEDYCNDYAQGTITVSQPANPTFSYSTANVSGFAVNAAGTITAPSAGTGTISSVTYVGSNSNTSYSVVYSATTRRANVTVTAPGGYCNSSASGQETDTQEATAQSISLGNLSQFNSSSPPQQSLTITQAGPATPTVSSKPTWITVGALSSSATSVGVSAADQPSDGCYRTGTITIAKSSASDSVSVAQSGFATNLSITTGNPANIGYAGGSYTAYTVSLSGCQDVKTASSDVSWLTGCTINASNQVSCTASKNTGAARSGNVIFKAGSANNQKTVTLSRTQNAYPALTSCSAVAVEDFWNSLFAPSGSAGAIQGFIYPRAVFDQPVDGSTKVDFSSSNVTCSNSAYWTIMAQPGSNNNFRSATISSGTTATGGFSTVINGGSAISNSGQSQTSRTCSGTLTATVGSGQGAQAGSVTCSFTITEP